MKVSIVVNAYIKNPSQILQAERIKEELLKLGAQAEILKNIGLAKIENSRNCSNIWSLCVFLDKDKAAARMLEGAHIKLINSARAMEICDNKILTHIELAKHGVPMPDAVYAPLCYYADAEISSEFLDGVESLSYPLVAKKCYGSLGEGVSLIKNRAELEEYEKANKLCEHLYQKFIGKGGEDIRVIVIGGKFVCSMIRKNDGDFRSNVGCGGKGAAYPADGKLVLLCEKVAEILCLDYCGIDVLRDGDNYFICEVNSNAFFAEAERVCGVNIAKKFAELIIASENA